jgi:amino acid permease
MREVGWLSFFGMATSVIATIVCISYSIKQKAEHPHVEYKTINYSLFPSAFSAITLSFGGHSTLPTIEQHSSSPKAFLKIVNYGFLILLLLYVPTAALGYMAFGENVESPILNSFNSHDGVIVTTKIIVAIHCLSAYPVLLGVVFSEIEAFIPNLQTNLITRSAVRATLVSITAIVAYFVPFFGDFMTFLGACCITMMVFVLPVTLTFKLRKLPWYEYIWCGFILAAGLTGGIIGAYQATKDLRDDAAE